MVYFFLKKRKRAIEITAMIKVGTSVDTMPDAELEPPFLLLPGFAPLVSTVSESYSRYAERCLSILTWRFARSTRWDMLEDMLEDMLVLVVRCYRLQPENCKAQILGMI